METVDISVATGSALRLSFRPGGRILHIRCGVVFAKCVQHCRREKSLVLQPNWNTPSKATLFLNDFHSSCIDS